MTIKRKVAGVELRKGIGRGHHIWVTVLAEQPIKFTAVLGRYNNKPLYWRASPLHPENNLDHDMHGSLFFVQRNTLKDCVKEAEAEALKRMRKIWDSAKTPETNHAQ